MYIRYFHSETREPKRLFGTHPVTCYGHAFVVTRIPFNDNGPTLFALVHVRTGLKVPGVYARSREEAKRDGLKFLHHKGRAACVAEFKRVESALVEEGLLKL